MSVSPTNTYASTDLVEQKEQDILCSCHGRNVRVMVGTWPGNVYLRYVVDSYHEDHLSRRRGSTGVLLGEIYKEISYIGGRFIEYQSGRVLTQDAAFDAIRHLLQDNLRLDHAFENPFSFALFPLLKNQDPSVVKRLEVGQSLRQTGGSSKASEEPTSGKAQHRQGDEKQIATVPVKSPGSKKKAQPQIMDWVVSTETVLRDERDVLCRRHGRSLCLLDDSSCRGNVSLQDVVNKNKEDYNRPSAGDPTPEGSLDEKKIYHEFRAKGGRFIIRRGPRCQCFEVTQDGALEVIRKLLKVTQSPPLTKPSPKLDKQLTDKDAQSPPLTKPSPKLDKQLTDKDVASAQTAETKEYVVRNERDVVSGRGNGISRMPGNIYFRHIVHKYRQEYRDSQRTRKKHVARKVLDEIQRIGGRFLESELGQGGPLTVKYILLPEKRIYEKIIQALREKNPHPQPAFHNPFSFPIRPPQRASPIAKAEINVNGPSGTMSKRSFAVKQNGNSSSAKQQNMRAGTSVANVKKRKKVNMPSDAPSKQDKSAKKDGVDPMQHLSTTEGKEDSLLQAAQLLCNFQTRAAMPQKERIV